MKKNSPHISASKIFALTALCLAMAGCESSLEDIASYDVDGACRAVPDVPDTSPQPVRSNDPVLDIFDLAEAITFDNSTRVTGNIPLPGSGGDLTFTNIVVTDKSIQDLFISSSALTESQRIGAVFIQLDGVSEYFAIPISLEDAEAAADSLLPQTITLRGPFPIEGTDPEPDLIQTQIISNITVAAFIVGSTEEAPDVTTVFDGINDTANWLTPATVPTITAENVGTGGITATLFWNTATDLDLWMIEPDGHKIYYADKNSTTGDGFLDFDIIPGYGPENIYFQTDIADGNYKVQVDYYGGSPAPVTNWSVSITACGSTRSFSGTLESVGDLDTVFEFNYSDNCDISERPPEPSDPSIFEEVVVCDPAALETLTE